MFKLKIIFHHIPIATLGSLNAHLFSSYFSPFIRNNGFCCLPIIWLTSQVGHIIVQYNVRICLNNNEDKLPMFNQVLISINLNFVNDQQNM